MATIQQDLAAIRTAVYGKDVREAIADGIENCYNESAQSGYSQLNTKVNGLDTRIGSLEDDRTLMSDQITQLTQYVDGNTEAIDTLTEGQNSLGVDISAVSGRVDETETDIVVLESMTEPTRNKLYITNHQKPGSFTINGVTVTINADGSFSFNGTVVSADAVIGLMGCTSKDDHKIPLGAQYTFGRKSENTGSNGTIRFRYDDESNQNVTISNGENVTFLSKASVYLQLPRGQAYTSTGKYYFWAESGDEIHDFVAYGNTPVDLTAREAIESSMAGMTAVMDDISEMSYNLFYMTGYEKPNTAWSTAKNGIKFRVNEDMTISFSGTCTAHTNYPLMGCVNSTDSYAVTGNRNLYYTRTLIGGSYSGNLPLKIVVKNESAVTFSYDDSMCLNDDACMYLQVRSGATFGTDSSPTTFAFQIVEGTEDKKIYEPYGVYIPKDAYARGVIPRVDALETENLPAIDRLPSYYHDNNYIENKLQTILTRAAQLETQSGNEVKHGYDTFAFITDMHLWWLDYGVNDKTLRNDPPEITVSNGMQSVKLLQTVRERTNVVKIFNGGDLLRGNVTTLANAQVWMGKVKEFLDPVWDNTYFVIGNHEWNNPDSSDDDPDKINRTAIYSQFVGDKSDRYGSISPVGDYWIDNTAEEIRYFFIHSNQSANIVNESIKWFGDEMLDIPDGYTVVVITHAAASGYSTWGTFTAGFTQIANIINAARTRVSYTYSDWTWDYKYAKYDIACVLSGHTHFDQIDHIPQDDAHGVPVIAIEADHWKSGVGTNGRNPRTITEQAFDVVQVDTTTRNIYLTRIGYGNDRSYTYPAGVANSNVKPSEVVLSNQGTENAGKALVVGDDGLVTTGDAGIPEAVKTALLEIFKHVAYVDASGHDYYNALSIALDGDTPLLPYTLYDYIGLRPENELRSIPTFSEITSTHNLALLSSVSANDILLKTKLYPDLWGMNYEFSTRQHTIYQSASDSQYNILLGGRSDSNQIFGFYQRVNGKLLSLQIKGLNRSSITEDNISTEKRTATVVTNNTDSKTIFSYAGNNVEFDWSGGASQNEGYLYILNNRSANDTSSGVRIPTLVYVGAVTLRNPDTLSKIDEYVPAVRNSDNVIGLYNKIDGVFYTVGDEKYATVGDPYCIYTVGNWS